jgi:hypothetical protein
MHAPRFRAKEAKRSCEAERSGEVGFGGLPRIRYNTTRPRAQQAKRSGKGKFLRLQINTRHEARMRAASSSLRRLRTKVSALGTPTKPKRDVLCNALLCSLRGGGSIDSAWPCSSDARLGPLFSKQLPIKLKAKKNPGGLFTGIITSFFF